MCTKIIPGLNQAYLDPKTTPKTFKTLDKALDAANKDAGDEVIVKVKDDVTKEEVFVMVDIKKGTSAASLFDPAAGVDFGNALITRDNKKVEVTFPTPTGKGTAQQVDQALELGLIALQDNVSGLKSSGAYDQTPDKMPAFQANLITVLQELNTAAEQLNKEKTALENDIAALEKGLASGTGNRKELEAAIAKAKKRLGEVSQKADTVTAIQVVMRSKLLLLPDTRDPKTHTGGIPIPGTKQVIGQFRANSSKANDDLIKLLHGEEGTPGVEQKLLLALKQDPPDIEGIKGLKGQVQMLKEGIYDNSISELQAKQAAMSTRIRMGALCKIDDEIGKAKTKLSEQTVKLAQLQEKLNSAPSDAIRSGIEKEVKATEAAIEKTRTGLIEAMKRERDVFAEHAPKLGGQLQKGGQAAVDLINVQIRKLESVAGLPADKIGAAVTQVQKDYRETDLLKQVEDAGKTFSGITPGESVKIKDIVAHTNEYLTDYEVAKAELKDLKKDIAAAKKLPQFQYTDTGALPFEYDKLSQAKYWTPGSSVISGSEGNQQITMTYQEMDDDFTIDYLGHGNDGAVPSWITFAKSGSGSAGAQIGNVEAALDVIKQLTDGTISLTDDSHAMTTLCDILEQPGIPTQFALLVTKIINDGIKNVDADIIKRGLSDIQRMRTALVEGNTEIYNNAIPLYRNFMKGESAGGKGIEEVKKLLDSPPPKGVWSDKAVKQQWAYHLGRPLTPAEEKMAVSVAQQNRGLILKAFDGYKKAHSLFEQSKLPSTTPDKKIELLKEHDKLIRQANMDFVSFEQLFAQPIYNKIHDLTGAMTGTVKLYDSAHPQSGAGMTLLPNLAPDAGYKGTFDLTDELGVAKAKTGNWADFLTRMGLVEVPAPAPGTEKQAEADGMRLLHIPVVDRNADGTVKDPIAMVDKVAWVKPDPNLAGSDKTLTTRGTIADYFLTTPSGKATEELIYKMPPMAKKDHTYTAPSTGEKILDTAGTIVAMSSPITAVPTVVGTVGGFVMRDELNTLEKATQQAKKDDEARKKAMNAKY